MGRKSTYLVVIVERGMANGSIEAPGLPFPRPHSVFCRLLGAELSCVAL